MNQKNKIPPFIQAGEAQEKKGEGGEKSTYVRESKSCVFSVLIAKTNFALTLLLGVRDKVIGGLRLHYMEKSCPGQEDRPLSRINLSERLYEKKALSPESRASRACSDRLALTEFTRLGKPKRC